MNTKPRGYLKYLLAFDCETTGLCFNSDNPCHNVATGEHHQMVSAGMIVVDADTLKPVDELYIEIQWDSKKAWNAGAEKIHGLSRQHLAEFGLSGEDAVVAIAELLIKYWGTDGVVSLIGHNVATFDKFFLQDLMREHGIEIKFGNRHVDTHSVAFSAFGTYNSDDAFDYVGIDARGDHNALEDARASLQVVQTVRELWGGLVEPNL